MCGIAGIASANKQLISHERIRSAVHCLRHRGPDAENVWVNEEHTVSLGHQRLSIIDLSNEAAQPMAYLDRYRIIHNGELYNYIEIKQQLLQKGYSFTTRSDTEVIAAAYDCFGQDCLEQFDGMFAFVIWDEKEKKLFAAKDRFGEKPFFFYYDGEQLTFASEIRSLWEMGAEKKVNCGMLYNFLTIGYTGNPADPQETFFENIRKLPCASFLTYHLLDNTLTVEKYWEVYPEVRTISEDEAIEKFRHLFAESIRKRLRSDVAIGTSLSGGLDSSSIVALCNREIAGQYSHKCFTASFKGFQKDEWDHADIVARQFGLEHHRVEIGQGEIAGLMEEVMRHQEEPFSSASVLAQYKLYRSAKEERVTVLLDGQGADEVLAGYDKYYKWYWQELYRNKKLNKSGEIRSIAASGAVASFGLKNKAAALFPEFAASLLQSRKAKQSFTHPDLDRDFAFSNKHNSYYATPASFDLNGVLYFNTFVSGLEELLRLADRNSMAHAVEIRLPFLSRELVEFLFSLPPGLKIHEGWTKWLLRKAVDDVLPEAITWRKDKVGFEPPQKSWMKDKNVQEAILHGKKKLASHGILKPSAAEKKIKPHNSYAADGWDWKYWSASFLFD